ncbi:glycosyltransferase family 2 protein [Plantactinospora soyae]|uniref:Glycosyltransferase involved in cell wall biosynthesis n=1 Tax=Plantactinospora soyae TaxID=1544732 RepID=A0A927LXT2_9ACTN|nr:glycosyltransferase family 2 protein [Plantactinospora soyae]MBE1484503.1 glycosyltransferase involved in cell wall biosynthesis [Plantactinospora soyae]
MTLLSVIVPVYQVEKYLADCLDSILGQSLRDIELVAVDDASTDGCARILARYAARDPRIVLVSLERNQGLGAARNAGLAQATGKYVWFVDSDDWLPDGALPAVADRLARTAPDLLVTAYTRHYPNGGVRHHPLSQAGAGRGAPETFTLRERPTLLSVLHITCNKVIRRQFLLEAGLTFGSGWYEDVSFTFPLMLAAGRISLLDRCCYAYRQRPGGAITSTVSERHFEVFAHWDRVLARLAADPTVPAELRHLIFQRMIWHLLQVLGHPRRVPPDRRREFFAEIVARYRAHLPAGGYRPPGGALGLKHRIVGHGGYSLFAALRVARRAHIGMVARIRQPSSEPVPAGAGPAPATVPGSRAEASPGELTDRVG